LALLGAAAYIEIDEPSHYGLVQIVRGALNGNPLFAKALFGDLPTVTDALTPMFDIFFVLAAFLSIVALIAFTPGELIEKLARPAMLALLGAMFGAFFGLAMVSAGFAGYVKHRTYTSMIKDEDVYDGDTIRMDDFSLRIADIDAPELNQTCRDATGSLSKCGEEARQRLAAIVRNQIVTCNRPNLASEKLSLALKETFGRPIVRCTRISDKSDIGATMVHEGFADVFRDKDGATATYANDLAAAVLNKSGVWKNCTLKPRAWRNERPARVAFENAKYSDIDQKLLLGKCPSAAAKPPSPPRAP
jgi:endonuclease YncB( thermonuclease family)